MNKYAFIPWTWQCVWCWNSFECISSHFISFICTEILFCMSPVVDYSMELKVMSYRLLPSIYSVLSSAPRLPIFYNISHESGSCVMCVFIMCVFMELRLHLLKSDATYDLQRLISDICYVLVVKQLLCYLLHLQTITRCRQTHTHIQSCRRSYREICSCIWIYLLYIENKPKPTRIM